MNLTLQIVRKDLWHPGLRLRFALWLGVQAVKYGLGYALLFGEPPTLAVLESLDVLNWVLMGAELLLTFLMAAHLVQEDGLVGTQQFWMTRPISGRRLLAAKAIGAGLLLGLPVVLLGLPWWITCGLGAAEMAQAAAEALLLQFIVAVPAMLVASLTDTVSRLLTWSIVLAIAVLTVPLFVTMVLAEQIVRGQRVSVTGALVAIGLAAVTMVAVAVGQYLQRRLKVSLVGLGVGLAIAMIVKVWWPWNWMGNGQDYRDQRRTERNAEWGSGVTVKPVEAIASTRNNDGQTVLISTLFELGGLPPDAVFDGGSVDHVWEWPQGLKIKEHSSWLSAWDSQMRGVRSALKVGVAKADAETERYRRQQRVESAARRQKLNAPNSLNSSDSEAGDRRWELESSAQARVYVRPSVAARMRAHPPRYEGLVQLRLARPQEVFELPFEAGGWRAGGGLRFRIASVRPYESAYQAVNEGPMRETGREAKVTITVPDFLRNRLWWNEAWYRYYGGETLFAFSRQAGDVDRAYFAGETWGLHLNIAGVRIDHGRIRLAAPQIRRGDQWVDRDPDWFSGVKIGLVNDRDQTWITRKVTQEKFELAK